MTKKSFLQGGHWVSSGESDEFGFEKERGLAALAVYYTQLHSIGDSDTKSHKVNDTDVLKGLTKSDLKNI